MRRFYPAEADVATSDIVWHVPGHNPVSGDYRGRQAYFETMPSRMAPLEHWEVVLKEVMVNGDFAVATCSVRGRRKGREVAMNGAHLLRINVAGQVAEGWGFLTDQDALDAFFV